MIKQLLIILTLILTAIVVSLYVNRPAQTQEVVRIAGMTWAGVGPGFVAQEKGYFEPYSVELLVLDDTRARQAAISSGDADVFITTIDQHAREFETGIPGKVAWLSDLSFGADGIVASSGINSVAELKGKTIALTLGTAAEYMLALALQNAGLDVTDVELVEVDDQAAIASAFVSGTLDAAVVWEPLLSQIAEQSGGNVLMTSADIPGSIIGVFVASDNFTDNDQALSTIINGWLKAVEDSKKESVTVIQTMAGGFGVDDQEIKDMIDGLRFADREIHQDYLCTKDGQTNSKLEQSINSTSQYWVNQGRQNAVPNPTSRISANSVKLLCADFN